tara:strand:- start:146 stop:610 length:465 start_codon:yes stop_codon:yes gene_type:complete
MSLCLSQRQLVSSYISVDKVEDIIVDEPFVIKDTFLFDSISIDIETLITKNIKWVKAKSLFYTEKLPYFQEVHRLYMITPLYKPIITFKDARWINLKNTNYNTKNTMSGGFVEKIKESGIASRYIDKVSSKVRTDKKGFIFYAKDGSRYKEIVA